MKRLKIGVDIDGVLADIVARMLPLLSRECGRPVVHEDIVCYRFSEALNIPEERVAVLMEEIALDGHYEAAPVVEGAVESLLQLEHHTIWLVTARPERTRSQTTRWLAQHGLRYHQLVFTTAAAKARQGDGFDLFIEDNLETTLGLSAEGIPVLLFDRPWNQHAILPDNVTRVSAWHEIVMAVERRSCA